MKIAPPEMKSWLHPWTLLSETVHFQYLQTSTAERHHHLLRLRNLASGTQRAHPDTIHLLSTHHLLF